MLKPKIRYVFIILHREETNVNKSCVYVKEREERETEAHFSSYKMAWASKLFV